MSDEYDEPSQQVEESTEGEGAESTDYKARYEEALKKAADGEKARKKEIAGLNRKVSELEAMREADQKKIKRYDRRRFSDDEIEEQERQEEIADSIKRDQEVERLKRELELTKAQSQYNTMVNKRQDISPINRRILNDVFTNSLPQDPDEFEDYLQEIADDEKRMNKLRARRGDVDMGGGNGETGNVATRGLLNDKELAKMDRDQRRKYFAEASDEEIEKMWKANIRNI